MAMVLRVAVLTLISMCAVVPARATDYWLPVAAHNPGAEGSTWRTDLSVYNPCDNDAAVEIIAHTSDGDFTQSYEITGTTVIRGRDGLEPAVVDVSCTIDGTPVVIHTIEGEPLSWAD